MDLSTRFGHTDEPDPEAAAAEIAAQIHQDDAACVLFFCTPDGDLDRLGAAIRTAIPGVPLFGATSAGQIGEHGMRPSGLTAVSLKSASLRVHVFVAHGLSADPEGAARSIAEQVDRVRGSDRPAFGLLLSDAMARMEERLTTSLYLEVGEVAIVGGSAADDLRFQDTRVYADGAFHRDAVGFALFETSLPFRTFKAQHFEPTEAMCVVTRTCPQRRLVYEIDGYPAAEGYARRIGVDVAALDAAVFAEHPLMIPIGDDWYVRSIGRVTPEGWLQLMCAIEEGEVLTVGRAVDIVAALDRKLTEVDGSLGGSTRLVIGCDCALRRAEIEHKGLVEDASRVLSRHRVFGFHTYGEQFNSVHVNHTFTGIAIGGLT